MQMDMIDGLELFFKDYHSSNHKLVKKARNNLDSLHIERTNVLCAQEDYNQAMLQLHNLDCKILEL